MKYLMHLKRMGSQPDVNVISFTDTVDFIYIDEEAADTVDDSLEADELMGLLPVFNFCFGPEMNFYPLLTNIFYYSGKEDSSATEDSTFGYGVDVSESFPCQNAEIPSELTEGSPLSNVKLWMV